MTPFDHAPTAPFHEGAGFLEAAETTAGIVLQRRDVRMQLSPRSTQKDATEILTLTGRNRERTTTRQYRS